MSDTNKNQNEASQKTEKSMSRRKAVRAIVIGGGVVTGAKGLPSEWAAPVVNSVILPSHAATTDDTDSGAGGNTTAAPTTVAPTTAAPTTTLCPPNYYYMYGYCYPELN